MLAADGPGVDALDPPRVVETEPARALALDQVPVDRLGDALELEAGQRLHVERASDVAIRVGRDQDAAAAARRSGGGWPG